MAPAAAVVRQRPPPQLLRPWRTSAGRPRHSLPPPPLPSRACLPPHPRQPRPLDAGRPRPHRRGPPTRIGGAGSPPRRAAFAAAGAGAPTGGCRQRAGGLAPSRRRRWHCCGGGAGCGRAAWERRSRSRRVGVNGGGGSGGGGNGGGGNGCGGNGGDSPLVAMAMGAAAMETKARLLRRAEPGEGLFRVQVWLPHRGARLLMPRDQP